MASIIFTYVFSSFENHPRDIWTSILINFQAVLLVSSRFNPNRPLLRAFFVVGLFVLLATTTTFLAFYYDFIIQSRYEKQIDTSEQIGENKLLLAGSTETKDYLMRQNLIIR